MTWDRKFRRPGPYCSECKAEAPAHYGDCSQVSAEMRKVLTELDRERDERKARDAEREAKVAPYGRNRFGVPKRPNEACVITVQCANKALAIEWAAFIRNHAQVADALPLPIVSVEDWPGEEPERCECCNRTQCRNKA